MIRLRVRLSVLALAGLVLASGSSCGRYGPPLRGPDPRNLNPPEENVIRPEPVEEEDTSPMEKDP